MGRGLSQQQRDILDVLPVFTEGMDAGDMLAARDVMEALGIVRTPSARASVSRAISRLAQRGLILHKYGWRRGYGHLGYARANPEQVKASRAELDAKRRQWVMQPPPQ